MRATRRLVLREPDATGEKGGLGERRQDPPKSHVVYAVREPDKGGTDGEIVAGVLGVESRRSYLIREAAVAPPAVVDEGWKVIDERGVTLTIRSVTEATTGARRRWLRLRCDRTTEQRALP